MKLIGVSNNGQLARLKPCSTGGLSEMPKTNGSMPSQPYSIPVTLVCDLRYTDMNKQVSQCGFMSESAVKNNGARRLFV